MGRLLLAVLVAAALVPTATGATARHPSSIVVLGHSGATGFGSDPAHPYRDAPAVNLAQDGATLEELSARIERAAALNPRPGLAVIQRPDLNHLSTPGQARLAAAERAAFSRFVG